MSGLPSHHTMHHTISRSKTTPLSVEGIFAGNLQMKSCVKREAYPDAQRTQKKKSQLQTSGMPVRLHSSLPFLPNVSRVMLHVTIEQLATHISIDHGQGHNKRYVTLRLDLWRHWSLSAPKRTPVPGGSRDRPELKLLNIMNLFHL